MVKVGNVTAVLISDHVASGWRPIALATRGDRGAIDDLPLFGDPCALMGQIHRDERVGFGLWVTSQQNSHEEEVALRGGEVDGVTMIPCGAKTRPRPSGHQGNGALHITPRCTAYEGGDTAIAFQGIAQVFDRATFDHLLEHWRLEAGVGISAAFQKGFQNLCVPTQ